MLQFCLAKLAVIFTFLSCLNPPFTQPLCVKRRTQKGKVVRYISIVNQSNTQARLMETAFSFIAVVDWTIPKL